MVVGRRPPQILRSGIPESTVFELRFPKSCVKYWAARYPATEDQGVLRLAANARSRGYLTRGECLVLGEWKTSRARKHRRANGEGLIREATKVALAARNEELKIGVLRVLSGVDWPTASVILHLCDAGDYPILDTRALWSAGLKIPLQPYSVRLWVQYTRFARRLARATSCSMRDVDRALWQYSKENEANA